MYKLLSQLYTTAEVTWSGGVKNLWYEYGIMSDYSCWKRDRPQNLGCYETYPDNGTSLQYKCYAAQSGEIVAKIPALGLFSPFWTSTAASAGEDMTVLTKQPTLRAGEARTLHLHAVSAASSTLKAGWLQGKPHSHLCMLQRSMESAKAAKPSQPNLMLSLVSTVLFSLRKYR